jgi:hypothetical protein
MSPCTGRCRVLPHRACASHVRHQLELQGRADAFPDGVKISFIAVARTAGPGIPDAVNAAYRFHRSARSSQRHRAPLRDRCFRRHWPAHGDRRAPGARASVMALRRPSCGAGEVKDPAVLSIDRRLAPIGVLSRDSAARPKRTIGSAMLSAIKTPNHERTVKS